ncbi:MAG: hypothetical protein Kow00109_04080 [Acidobacteriota bacterium]
MSGFHVVVCGGLVPDPLQTLQPVQGPQGPAVQNEAMLPMVLDPWAAHALYEAANLARQQPETRVWWLTLGPRAKLQQLLMTVAQKVPFELVALDGPAGGFTDTWETAAALADAVTKIPDLDRNRLLLFGGWESASRGAGVTLQLVGERLGVRQQFQGVDRLEVLDGGKLRILERMEGGKHLVSVCAGPPAVLGWATGFLPEPPNNPQVGMLNMRTAMPALQRAVPSPVGLGDVRYVNVAVPDQRRQTRIVKDVPLEEMARELVEWIRRK